MKEKFLFTSLLIVVVVLAFQCRNRPSGTTSVDEVAATETSEPTSQPNTPTPPPTTELTALPTATSNAVATLTPTPRQTSLEALKMDSNPCPDETIPVPWHQARHAGRFYEEGLLSEIDGELYYPSIDVMTGLIALRISDQELGNPRFWDGVPYTEDQEFVGIWQIPPYSLVEVISENGISEEFPNLVAGPTGRMRDLSDGNDPYDITISAGAWQTLFGGDLSHPKKVTAVVLRCGE